MAAVQLKVQVYSKSSLGLLQITGLFYVISRSSLGLLQVIGLFYVFSLSILGQILVKTQRAGPESNHDFVMSHEPFN